MNQKNIVLDEIPKDKTPVVQQKPTVIDYKTFILACRENKYNSFKDLVEENKTVIDMHISTYLKDDKNKDINFIKIILDISPDAIFKIVRNDNFGTIFPEIKNKIDPKVVDDNNRNFYYYLKHHGDIIQILESNIDSDINHVDNNGMTFVTYLACNNIFKNESLANIVNCLRKTKYDFNNISKGGQSIFCCALNATTFEKQFSQAEILVQIPKFDILIETTWLESLVKKNNQSYNNKINFKNLIISILNRNDYKSFLLRLINKYLCKNAEKDLITICICTYICNAQKFKKMLIYVDADGNTFVHCAARLHFKQLLNIIYPVININAIKTNNNGKTPADLYRDGKITNIFSSTQ